MAKVLSISKQPEPSWEEIPEMENLMRMDRERAARVSEAWKQKQKFKKKKATAATVAK